MRTRRDVPGSLMSVGGDRLYVYRAGRGAPTVVFEAALAGCHAHWTVAQARLAESMTTCSYDRAGLGWSDPGPGPRTAERIARELQRLLGAAEIPPPRVMVGHSFGALPLRVYAAMFPAEVAGLVLLDPMEPEEWIPMTAGQRRTIEKGIALCRRGAFAARVGLARTVAGLANAGSTRLARRVVSLASRGGFTSRDDHILAPFTKSAPEVRRAMSAMWTRPKCFEALADEIRSIPVSVLQAAGAEIPREVPVTVLSASDARPSRVRARERFVSRFACGRHAIAPASGHWIHLDEPGLVVEAVQSIMIRAAT